jgi:hypothetical protein
MAPAAKTMAEPHHHRITKSEVYTALDTRAAISERGSLRLARSAEHAGGGVCAVACGGRQSLFGTPEPIDMKEVLSDLFGLSATRCAYHPKTISELHRYSE